MSAKSTKVAGEDNEKNQAGKTLMNDQIQPFMSDTDPRNPYGSNYEELEYETKIFYKYTEIKKHVHLQEPDQQLVIKANFIYLAGVTFSVLGSLGIGYALKKAQAFKRIRSMHILVEEYSKFYYGLFVASSGSASYFFCNKYYINEVCKPLMMKYLQEAKQNGFQDYKISETKPIDWEKKLLGPSYIKKQ